MKVFMLSLVMLIGVSFAGNATSIDCDAIAAAAYEADFAQGAEQNQAETNNQAQTNNMVMVDECGSVCQLMFDMMMEGLDGFWPYEKALNWSADKLRTCMEGCYE